MGPLRSICSSGGGLAGGFLVGALLAVISVDKLEVINFIICSRSWPSWRRGGGSGGDCGFCWLMGGWFCMHKVDIAVTDAVLDDALLIDIVVNVLKIGSFVMVNRFCPG